MNVYYTDIDIKIVIEYVNKIAWSRFYVFSSHSLLYG